MSANVEGIGRKLSDLRVCDLKVELEKRSLDSTGIKSTLVEKLQKALLDEGHNPDVFLFEPMGKRISSSKRQSVHGKSKADDEDDEDVIAIEECEPDEHNESSSNGVLVDEVGEIDTTAFSSNTTEANNVDNEDSLNLTIGEDEEKIFQDEEIEKEKDKQNRDLAQSKPSDKKATNTNDSSSAAERKTNPSEGQSIGGAGNSTNTGDKETGKTEDKIIVIKKEKEDPVISNNSELKSSSKTSAKDEKEITTTTKTTSSSSATSSTAVQQQPSSSPKKKSITSLSRNLWVSGLSSLTRATDLKIIFSKYGKVIGAKVVTNTRTPGTRCYGYVTMSSFSEASKCIDHLHRTELHGRIIFVERAKSDISVSGPLTSSSPLPSSSSTTTTAAAAATTATTTTTTNSASKSTTKSTRIAITAPDDGKKPTEENTKGTDSKKPSIYKDANINNDSKTFDKDNKDVEHTKRDDRKHDSSQSRRHLITTNSSSRHEHSSSRRSPSGRDVLSFQKIREERERQRLRERERKLREEERRRIDQRRRQREEEDRLIRERERLKKERLRLEREKSDLLRLERERQKLEREKIELERLELKRQQLKIEEARRAIKRPATDRDRYSEIDRKRTTSDTRHFEPPPPPRFDTSISSSSLATKRDDYKRDEYKRETIRRPVTDYGKSTYDSRSLGVHRNDTSTKERYAETSDRSSNSFNRSRADERDTRPSSSSIKSRYVDSSSTNDGRYAERSSTSTWANSGPTPIKPFHIQSVAIHDPWGQKPATESSWRSMEQNQDRYDRTYNERKQTISSQYIDQQARTQPFASRPQDRYATSISSRFESNRF